MGAVVLGDVLNGKVPTVEHAIESLQTGYAAVWYHDEGGELRQAVSYLGFQSGSYSAHLAGAQLALGGRGFIEAAGVDSTAAGAAGAGSSPWICREGYTWMVFEKKNGADAEIK